MKDNTAMKDSSAVKDNTEMNGSTAMNDNTAMKDSTVMDRGSAVHYELGVPLETVEYQAHDRNSHVKSCLTANIATVKTVHQPLR